MRQLFTWVFLITLTSFSIFTTSAADVIEDNWTSVSEVTTTTADININDLNFTISPEVTDNNESITLSIKTDELDTDITWGAIYIKFDKNSFLYDSIEKWTLVWTNDILNVVSDLAESDWIIWIEFTSEENQDMKGDIFNLTFLKWNITEETEYSFEIYTDLELVSELITSDSSIISLDWIQTYIWKTIVSEGIDNIIPEEVVDATALDTISATDNLETNESDIQEVTTIKDATTDNTWIKEFLLLSFLWLLLSFIILTRIEKSNIED